MSRVKDLTGMKFNRLTVLKFSHMDKKSNSMWLCRCECGNEKLVRGSELTSGGTKSCRLPTKGKGQRIIKKTWNVGD